MPSKYPQPIVSLRPSRVARPLPPSPHHALSPQLINGALHGHDVCASAKESLLHILSVLLSVPAFDFDKLPAVLSSTLIQVSPSRTRPHLIHPPCTAQGLRSPAAGVRKESVVCAGILRRNGKLAGFATLDKAEQSLVSLYCAR